MTSDLEARSRTLLTITAFARSGAVEHAWQLFHDSRLDRVFDDPNVLTVKGRLLKDAAFSSQGQERKAAAAEAAAAYGAAAKLMPATYPLINAAMLALIAGRSAECAALAREVLVLLEDGDPEETPYYLAATEAEALLLLGRAPEAEAALARAIARAPKAWEDHASTLRQFSVILAERGVDDDWLDRYRPPSSLHFSGLMTIGADEKSVAARVDEFLFRQNIGFGYGALAAGADLLVAERLLEYGAQLHVVLPSNCETFKARSVVPYGADWPGRFEQALAKAETLVETGDAAEAAYPCLIKLADSIATGKAVMNGRNLQSAMVSLQLTAEQDDEPQDEAVPDAHRRHRLPVASRKGPAIAMSDHYALSAIVALDLADPNERGLVALERDVVERAQQLSEALALEEPLVPQRWVGTRLVVTFSSAVSASRFATLAAALLRPSGPMRIGLHTGVTLKFQDPLTNTALLLGEAIDLTLQTVDATPAGALYATEHFVSSMEAEAPGEIRAEFIGELSSDLKADVMNLYAIGSITR